MQIEYRAYAFVLYLDPVKYICLYTSIFCTAEHYGFLNACLLLHFETSYIMAKINDNAMIEPKPAIINLFPCKENSHIIESGLHFNMDDALPRVFNS